MGKDLYWGFVIGGFDFLGPWRKIKCMWRLLIVKEGGKMLR